MVSGLVDDSTNHHPGYRAVGTVGAAIFIVAVRLLLVLGFDVREGNHPGGRGL